MYTNSILAFSGALLSAVAAVPMAEPHRHHHHVRDYVYVPHTEIVYETVAVTKTVWVEPGEYTPESKPQSTPESKPQGYTPVASKPETTPAANTPAAYTPPAPPAYTPETTSSSSVYVPPPAPTTPTSTYVAPAPTYEAPAPYVPPTSEAAPAPAPAATSPAVKSSGSGLSGMAAPGKSYTGDLTWYDVGMGACGKTNVASDPVIAIPEAIFDSYSTGNPNTNPLCGKTITITGKDGSKFTGIVVDRCPGCTVNDLDLSQDFFNKVTNNGDGRVGDMEWCFD
ncbi:putative RlpA-like domain superfamily protein [Septoria linicola]|nr:putative RlpA-like domain superfamily protein [Septoria linicola]